MNVVIFKIFTNSCPPHCTVWFVLPQVTVCFMPEDVIVVNMQFFGSVEQALGSGSGHLTTVAAVRLKGGSVQVPGQEVDAPVISVTPVSGPGMTVMIFMLMIFMSVGPGIV